MAKSNLRERIMQMAAAEVANGTMSCKEAANHYYVDQAVLVHVAEAKVRAMCEGQRTGTYRQSK